MELPRSRSGVVNPELSSLIQAWAERTAEEGIPCEGPTVTGWQLHLAHHRRDNLQAANHDPARMVQYVAGRPCVVFR